MCHCRVTCAGLARPPTSCAARTNCATTVAVAIRSGSRLKMKGMASLDLRLPAVAGRFYPGRADELAAEVARCLGDGRGEGARHVAVVAPHAGYVYSGAIAGRIFAATRVPRRVVVLAP